MISRLSWPPTVAFKREPFAWVAGGVASLLLFLFLTFPFGTLQARVLSELVRATGWEIRAVEWSPGLPLAVEWREVTWTKPGSASILIQLMRLNVGVLAMLFGQQTVDALVQFPGGAQPGTARATGTVSASSWSFVGPLSLKAHAQQIDLGAVIKPYVTRGLLQADVTQRWENRGKDGIAFKGDGSWKAEVKDLVLERIPVGPAAIPSLNFSRVTAALTCRDAVCDITDFKADGPDGTISAQGRLLLREPVQSSLLEVTVTVLAGAGWAQKAGNLPIPPLPPGTPLTVKLGGSVANPKLTL
ncbi:MAG TPA: type II secretion system protein GspN [Nitrospira sp.]|jgi:type II secretion system protein N|nr:type II secretion system protein GspN [Nitrospira sp.]